MTRRDRTEVPMFPLGMVLAPGGAMPLHVFEPRYRALARRCVDNGEPFGVALIERGSEVGGGDVRTDVACLAEIAEHEELPDGRWAMIAVGTERVRVDQWLEDDPYPRALVSDWPDTDEDVSPELRADAIGRVVRVIATAAEAGYQVPSLDVETAVASLGDSEMSHRLASSVPIGPFDRQRLLCAEGPAQRLELLADLLEGVELILLASMSDGDDSDPGDASDDPPSGML